MHIVSYGLSKVMYPVVPLTNCPRTWVKNVINLLFRKRENMEKYFHQNKNRLVNNKRKSRNGP